LARHHVSRSIVLPREELPFRRLNGLVCSYCGSLSSWWGSDPFVGPVRALSARNSYVERHPIFRGSVWGSLAYPIPGRYSVCSPVCLFRYSRYSRQSLLVILQPGGSRNTAHRKKRAVETTCSAGRENNLVPGPLYGGSPVHVRSFTIVGCWDGRQVTAPPSLGETGQAQ
jgi:hypothetical protein